MGKNQSRYCVPVSTGPIQAQVLILWNFQDGETHITVNTHKRDREKWKLQAMHLDNSQFSVSRQSKQRSDCEGVQIKQNDALWGYVKHPC